MKAVTIEDLATMLHAVAIERGYRVTGDGFVNTRAAADLLGRTPGTLANWRAQHDPIPHRSIRGRVQYPLWAIAEYLLQHDHEASRSDIDSARQREHARRADRCSTRRRSA